MRASAASASSGDAATRTTSAALAPTASVSTTATSSMRPVRLEAFSPTLEETLEKSEVVVESVFEDPALKRDLFVADPRRRRRRSTRASFL